MSSVLKQQFVSETREQLEQIAKDVMTLEKAGASTSVFDSLFRQVHTLKGNCGLFDEMAVLARTLHHGEDQLDKLRANQAAGVMPEKLADLLLELLDFVEEVISRFESDDNDDPSANPDFKKRADQLATEFAKLNQDSPSPPQQLLETILSTKDQQDSHLPVWVSENLALAANCQQDQIWIHYTPDEQAFFTGEDPLLNILQVPKLVGSKALWPSTPSGQLDDPFVCKIRLVAVSTASLSSLEEALTYVLDHCEFYPLSPATLSHSNADSQPPATNPHQAPFNESVKASARALWSAQLLCLKPLTGRNLQDPLLQRQLKLVGMVLRNLAQSLNLPHWNAHIDLALEAGDLPQILETLATPPLEIQAQVPPQEASPASPCDTSPNQTRLIQTDNPVAEETTQHPSASNQKVREILRVPRERIDRFMDLVGEMVVAKNALSFLAGRAEDDYGNRELARLMREHYAVVNRIVDDMQDAVMRVRMTPVDTVFQRFPRLVRDLARQLGKQVELKLSGEDTEADKNMIERLAEPMIHLVRNTLDHGIEPPENRKQAGKPPTGTLEIKASQDGDRVLIELIDDGAGINRDKVASKALEKGLKTAEQIAQMKGQEIDNLIFAPGFSTADQISAVSGRGVGMDAVRSSIESMGGEVRLQSEQGVGLKVSISLPLSMAVSRVMVIESGDQKFGLPVDAIVETVRRPGHEFKQLQGAQALVMRNKLIPLRSLNDLLEMEHPVHPNEEGEWAILVCRVRGQRVGLIIDDFKGTADVLIKPMGGVLSNLTHFHGTALLGDGSVLLVLDLMEIFNHEHSN